MDNKDLAPTQFMTSTPKKVTGSLLCETKPSEDINPVSNSCGTSYLFESLTSFVDYGDSLSVFVNSKQEDCGENNLKNSDLMTEKLIMPSSVQSFSKSPQQCLNPYLPVQRYDLNCIPVSPRLKNRVRERLFTLVNQIDGYNYNVSSSETGYSNRHLFTETDNTELVNNICQCSVSNRAIKRTPINCSCHCTWKESRSMDKTSTDEDSSRLSILQNVMENTSDYASSTNKYDRSVIEGNLTIPDISNFEDKSSIIKIYSNMLADSLRLIDSMKTRILELEQANWDISGRACMKSSENIDVLLNNTTCIDGVINKTLEYDVDVGQDTSSFAVERKCCDSFHDQDKLSCQIQILENTLASLKSTNEDLLIENQQLKATIKKYEETETELENKATLRDEELQKTCYAVLQKERDHYVALINSLKSKLKLAEEESEQTQPNLTASQQEASNMKLHYKKQLHQTGNNALKNLTATEYDVAAVEKYYQNLLKENQEYAFAQIFEYKKAVRSLKDEIARMKENFR